MNLSAGAWTGIVLGSLFWLYAAARLVSWAVMKSLQISKKEVLNEDKGKAEGRKSKKAGRKIPPASQ